MWYDQKWKFGDHWQREVSSYSIWTAFGWWVTCFLNWTKKLASLCSHDNHRLKLMSHEGFFFLQSAKEVTVLTFLFSSFCLHRQLKQQLESKQMKTESNVEMLRNFVPLPIPPFPLRITSIHSCCVSKGRKEGIVQISSKKMDSKRIKSLSAFNVENVTCMPHLI